MSFRELEYIMGIEKYHNITKAAEAMFISQPTLSKFLQSYEKELGLRLFERSGNRYYLTYAEERYLHYAQQILLLEGDMKRELEELAANRRGRLSIGYQMNRSAYAVPLTIPKFKAEFPEVDISIQERSSEALEQMLLDGALDIVVFNYPVRNPQLDYEVIDQEELLLITPWDHPLYGKQVEVESRRHPYMDLTLFAQEPFILQHSDQTTGRAAREILEDMGISPPIVLKTRNIEGTVRLVEAGVGCSFVIESGLMRAANILSNVRSFSVGQTSRNVDLVVAHRKSDYLTKHAQSYIRILRDSIRRT